MNKITSILLLVLSICFISIGCERYDVIYENSNNFPQINPLSDDNIELILFYPNQSMEYLVPEYRVVSRSSEDVEKIAIEELLMGTRNKNLRNIIPDGTKILSIYVTDNIAYISFTNELINQNYTEKDEALTIYSIVNTLTSLPNINEVQILVDGKAENVLHKHYSIKEPLSYSNLIVAKNYNSPISVVNEYYSYLIDEDYDKAMKLLYLDNISNIRYNTIKAYLKDEFKGTNQHIINNYIINEYDDGLNINMNITFTYEKNNIKTSKKLIELIYREGTFLIKG